MADETEILVITQPQVGKGRQAFRHAGSDCDPPIAHQFEGGITHRTDQPVVHMHLWNEDCVGKLDGQVVVRGDREAPVAFEHSFANDHRQSHRIETRPNRSIMRCRCGLRSSCASATVGRSHPTIRSA